MERSHPGKRSHLHDRNRQPSTFTRRHFIFAGTAAAATLGYWSYATKDSAGAEEATSGPPTSTSSTTSTTQPAPPATPAALAAPTTTIPPLAHDLGEGMVGTHVEALQSTLARRQFDPGPIDGIFGGATLRAVWAFEKLVLGTPRDEMRGIVTQDIWEQMNSDFRVAPRRTPGGTHMEVYLPEQVSVLFENGEARVISHVSSGAGVEWCDVVEIDLDDGTTEEKGICGMSITPGGVYHFERKIDGWRNAKLGRLYKPVYFNYGIAIHGAGSVPAFPASRGCVRHPMHIAEYLPDLIEVNDMIYVFDGVEEPETYGAQPMIFDYPDPDWVPPTTTTTTTTIPPTTTVPPTTAPPATSTTIAQPASLASASTTIG
ncbi:MAG TPA: L,D-transpeptidase family protein [Ilumatobacteraceae bacterium]|nr:L,D-transpeptidase family protein [Ilumatobacteraceae bacterium]